MEWPECFESILITLLLQNSRFTGTRAIILSNGCLNQTPTPTVLDFDRPRTWNWLESSRKSTENLIIWKSQLLHVVISRRTVTLATISRRNCMQLVIVVEFDRSRVRKWLESAWEIHSDEFYIQKSQFFWKQHIQTLSVIGFREDYVVKSPEKAAT